MVNVKRSTRVAELLRQEMSTIIARELKDPGIGMATVCKIRLSDDLKFAKVFISIIGDEKQVQNSLEALERATNFIRSELRKRTDLRAVPELRFEHDDSATYAQNIDILLNKIHKEK